MKKYIETIVISAGMMAGVVGGISCEDRAGQESLYGKGRKARQEYYNKKIMSTDEQIAEVNKKSDSIQKEIDLLSNPVVQLENDVERAIDSVFRSYTKTMCDKGRAMGKEPKDSLVLETLRAGKERLNEEKFMTVRDDADHEAEAIHEKALKFAGCLTREDEGYQISEYGVNLELDLTKARIAAQAKYSKQFPYIRYWQDKGWYGGSLLGYRSYGQEMYGEYKYIAELAVLDTRVYTGVYPYEDIEFFGDINAKYEAVLVGNNSIKVVKTAEDGTKTQTRPFAVKFAKNVKNDCQNIMNLKPNVKNFSDMIFDYWNDDKKIHITYTQYNNIKRPADKNILPGSEKKIVDLQKQYENLQRAHDSLTKVRENLLQKRNRAQKVN
ncbi:MAG: hypothetical protein K5912_00895 [Alphaproteobacteria bacterium]|nr:hypothetical protein [Alphaproteobacteria bacterium]